MDIDAGYVDVAIARWQAMTGEHAILDGEDRSFDDIAATRSHHLA